MKQVVLRIENASKSMGRRTLWEHLDLEVAAGEVVAIRGESGSGKSTLLNCIGGLDAFDSGRIFFQNRELTDASTRDFVKLRRESLCYLFQDFALIDEETVAENLALGFRGRLARSEAHRRMVDALHLVGLDNRLKSRVFELSGGEQQRVAVARMLLKEPELILADEPTASLDRENATSVLGVIRKAADNGAAALVVSHDPWVIEHCDRAVSLNNGKED